jgi:hypothetical protein
MEDNKLLEMRPIPDYADYVAGSDGNIYTFKVRGRGKKFRFFPLKLSIFISMGSGGVMLRFTFAEGESAA